MIGFDRRSFVAAQAEIVDCGSLYLPRDWAGIGDADERPAAPFIATLDRYKLSFALTA